MSNNMTTTGNMRVEDITFKGARKQSQVLADIAERFGDDQSSSGSVQVPVSLTPESVKTFYNQKIADTKDIHERCIYQQTIRWIDECLDAKKKLAAFELKYKEVEESPEDI